jgi:hypothetical protein
MALATPKLSYVHFISAELNVPLIAGLLLGCRQEEGRLAPAALVHTPRLQLVCLEECPEC